MLGLVSRKYIRFRRTLVGNEDLLEEIADCTATSFASHRKKKIMALKVGQTNISVEQLSEIPGSTPRARALRFREGRRHRV